MEKERAIKAANFAIDFVMPFATLMGKLKAAQENKTGTSLDDKEVETLMTAFQILKKQPRE